MLRFIRQGQRWIVTALVVAIGAVFILFFGPWDFTQTGASAAVPIEVNGRQYTREDVMRVRDNLEERYREVLGDAFDPARDLQLRDQAVRQLVDRAILADEARRLGLAAGDAEVERMIRGYFADLRDDRGQLDEERARQFVIYEWGSVRRFKEEVRTDLVLQQIGRLLLSAAGASKAEARDSLRYRGERVRIAFVALDPTTPPPELEVLPGDVEEFARREAERIRAYYDENAEAYTVPERLRLRHILVRALEDDDELTRGRARIEAEAARGRVEAGEDMAAVARELSDDEGSKERGGDLGLVPRTSLAGELLDAVEGLEPGELSPVVQGPRGFHVVRIEERQPAGVRPFEEVRFEIAEELYRQDQAASWVTRTADDLEAGIAAGKSLETAARELRLNIERTGFFNRRPDGFIGGLGDSAEVQAAAFALSDVRPTWPDPLQVGDRTVFIQLLERRGLEPGQLETAVDEEQARLTEAAQQTTERIWLSARRSQLQAGGRIHVDPSALE